MAFRATSDASLKRAAGARLAGPVVVNMRTPTIVLVSSLVVAVARDLGIDRTGLSAWIKQARVDAGKGPPGSLTSEEKAELTALRKEVRVLKEERRKWNGERSMKRREGR